MKGFLALNNTQNKSTQYRVPLMLSVVFLFLLLREIYAKCRYTERRFAECRYSDRLFAECLYAECHYAECR
jgi:hypothetical protein